MNYRQERIDLLKWVKKQLIGEKLKDDTLIENNPFDRYFTGILYPISESQDETENEIGDESSDEDSEDISPVKKSMRYQPPSSMGFSFYMQGGEKSLRVFFNALQYADEGRKKNIRSWKKLDLGISSEGQEIVFNSNEGVALSKIIWEGKGRIDVVWRSHNEGQIATVSLTNIQNLIGEEGRDEKAEKSLFEVELRCIIDNSLIFDYPSVNKALLSEEEKEIELRYKDERIYAVGHGVAVDWKRNKLGDLEIYSDFMPVVEVPQVTADTSDGSSKALSFDFLTEIETNASVVDELKSYILEYDGWVTEQQKLAENEPRDDRDTAERIVKNMLIAKQRMMTGVSLLERNALAKKAFGIANKAMLAQMRGSLEKNSNADKNTYNWRPFQLAFILMVLESAIDEDSDFRDIVDLIWFPTGGGKTEAYLGLMAFLFAYRRMRYPASSGGTIAIMRYTLRLLTAQQFMRACKVISALELIRQADDAHLGKAPFTVGLWLGAATSPNTFKQAIEKIRDKQCTQLVLTSCPWGASENLPTKIIFAKKIAFILPA